MTAHRTEQWLREHQRRHGRPSAIRPSAGGRKRAVVATSKVDYARMLARQIRDAGLRQPILEYAFDRQLDGAGLRDWRIDLAYPYWTVMDGRRGKPLAVEVDGAVHRIKGRHKGDMEKHQALFAQGWDLLRVSPAQVKDGSALELVIKALNT